MAFPYLTDAINTVFGTHWQLPVPTFGLVVAIAVVVATSAAFRVARDYEVLGTLPPRAHAQITDMVLVSTLAGIVGARLFDILDHIERFLASPMSMILTRAGFSIYGGLCFGIAVGILFVRRRSLPVRAMLDVAAPAMMLGYGIGRLGCQLSGDGDWGIAANMLLKPHWLPNWLWAQTYDGNIAGVSIAPPGVYPTPLYEIAMALAAFWILWRLRFHKHGAGYLFSIYLLLAGFERLLIEKIRTNTRYDLLGVQVTQAEAISFLLVVAGLIGVLVTLRRKRLWTRILVSAGVLCALSACAPH
ncbi:MAG TPA: prolipoprotein diacylglyceryl transferase family protein [Steroidobacteraceae bacterium]|nr:prolipoprotein diacylglyceryl transferase family protein [Steroidobacteraceae bacterium]